mmetsp:Transcript_61281/g.200372  ORF Transcript_61281/g.200372 Transcript_61281/m.200372 type:complete len:206 (+) Transcript_61281:324-941(+)
MRSSSFVVGCGTLRRQACKATRPGTMALTGASGSAEVRPPYMPSPTSGKPTCEAWTRIWCVRPDSSSTQESRTNWDPAPLAGLQASTSSRVAALWPSSKFTARRTGSSEATSAPIGARTTVTSPAARSCASGPGVASARYSLRHKGPCQHSCMMLAAAFVFAQSTTPLVGWSSLCSKRGGSGRGARLGLLPSAAAALLATACCKV